MLIVGNAVMCIKVCPYSYVQPQTGVSIPFCPFNIFIATTISVGLMIYLQPETAANDFRKGSA